MRKSVKEMQISREEMYDLISSENAHLVANKNEALTFFKASGHIPSLKGSLLAYHFWNLAIIGVLGGALYLTFTSQWWWIISGIAGSIIIANANVATAVSATLKAVQQDDLAFQAASIFNLLHLDTTE